MRCNNCGYINDDGEKNCIKCNAPLTSQDDRQYTMGSQTVDDNDFQPSATVSEATDGGFDGIYRHVGASVGRRRPQPETVGTDLNIKDFAKGGTIRPNARPISNDNRGTINPWMNKSNGRECNLVRIDVDDKGQEIMGDGVSFGGRETELSRAILNPTDPTISSRQAILTQDGDGWYIEDCSTYRTTMLVARRRMKLEEGDIVVMGQSRFMFTERQ